MVVITHIKHMFASMIGHNSGTHLEGQIEKNEKFQQSTTAIDFT